MDQPTFRQRLALRLEGHLLLRTLVLDTPFLWVFCLGLILTVGVIVSVPKVWPTTPKDFPRGTVRVSVIDLVQSWSLSQSAQRADAAGDYDAALLAWRGALANNLGNPDRHRQVLKFLRDVPEARPDQVMLGLVSSSWLLALANTNVPDLELVAQVLEKYTVPGYALEVMAASTHRNDPALAPARARCSFSAGRIEDFTALWNTYESVWKNDAGLKLYHDAYVAGWETGSPAIEAILRLKAEVALPGNGGLTAARLLLAAGAKCGSADDVALALKRLDEVQSASVTQHATYWRLLSAQGRFNEAQEKARLYQSRPQVAAQAAEYAAILAALGLRDEALTFLESNLAKYDTHPAIWEVYLSILIDARKWNEIRKAAATVRVRAASFETARILALFAEYRAEVGDGRDRSADTLASQLAEARILDNHLALSIARSLVRDGRAGAALRLLQGKKAELRDREVYWQSVFGAAIAVKDIPALRESTTECLRLSPNNPVALSNRAAMLIAIEDQPTEALEITFRLISEFPNSAPFLINHAFALLLNRRVEEAYALLTRLDPSRLERQAAAAFHLAMTETLYARGQYPEALDESGKVQPGLILPPQAERLERLRRELRAKI